ncbi:hypothetical protein F5X99DRAFT_414050 [Biscogniauxia marginata]|nr:hypothetical protein F5X99DRAFT_414050 [Biscogniauxia marginata]
MSDIPDQPKSPADWQKYATSREIAKIPLKQGHSDKESQIATYHDVYIDGSTLLKTSPAQLYVYTDVLALDDETVFNLPKNATVTILARVITAVVPKDPSKTTTLRVIPAAEGECVISIWASQLDQDVAICARDSELQRLDLGPKSEYLGVNITINGHGDTIHLDYHKRYGYDASQEHKANLQTQLRIASVLFWRKTAIAISLCAHVATFTMTPSPYYLLNSQAVSLGQQLAAQAMTVDGSSYAPVLQLDRYMKTLDAALEAASDFEQQYDLFDNREQEVDDQKVQWQVMLDKARDEESIREYQRQVALDKYEDAAKTAEKCYLQMEADNAEVQIAGDKFNPELQRWEQKQKFLAVCKILGAIVGFAFSVGGMFLGGGGSDVAAEVSKAINTVEDEEKAASQIAKVVSSDTLKNLKKCVEVLKSLYPKINQIVDAVKVLERDPNAEIPSSDTIPGLGSGDADAATLVTLASWDAWVLESDLSLKFAIDHYINTADTYQLILRKHAINGKLLAQAQAEAVKAGQQYVQAAMEVVLCQKDVARLESLIKDYQGQEVVYEEAKASLFDRFMALRTSLVIEMRSIVWAYKYYALKDSRVVLDVLKSAVEYKQDRLNIMQDIDDADSQYARDDQRFDYKTPSYKLPSNYHQLILDGLKSSPDHKASFTLSPDLDSDGKRSFAADFRDGFHYRLEGMEPTLRGAMPQPDKLQDGKVDVVLQITTSGLYQDVQDGQLFSFTSIHQVSRFSYELKASSEVGDVRDHAIFETKNHAEPTPFTQWTIKLLTPENVDLSGLEAVVLYWRGHNRFPEARHRRN